MRFGLGAAEYEIDLSAANAGRFREQLAPFVEHARKAGREQRAWSGRTVSARRSSAEVRPGPGSTGSRSANAGGSRLASPGSTRQPQPDASPGADVFPHLASPGRTNVLASAKRQVNAYARVLAQDQDS